jgi:hypothetical protein
MAGKKNLTTHVLVVTLILSIWASIATGCQESIRNRQSQPESTLVRDVLPEYPQDQQATYQTVLEEFSILNRHGEEIHGLIRRPDPGLYPGMRFAAVVKVPGGINPGRSEALTPESIALAEAGMVVVTFNAESRFDPRNPEDIPSQGTENYNGFENQDTLAEIFAYTTQLPLVISDNVGIRSQSYGITMAAGCAARHPELNIKYIVDGEGPPNSFVTVQEPRAMFSPPGHPLQNKYQTVFGILGHYSLERDPSEENHAFWEEREAILFIGEFNGMYLRLQGEWDHSQPPGNPGEIEAFHQPPIWWQGKHTCDIVNAALDGGVPWVRVNLPEQGNPINQRCSMNNMPTLIPGELNKNPLLPVLAVIEMARADGVQR